MHTLTSAERQNRPGRKTRVRRALKHWCIAVCAALALSSTARGGELLDRVMVVVNGDLILQSDVQAAIGFGLIDVSGAADPQRLALSRLIDRDLVLDEVNRYLPPEPEPAAVDAEVRIVHERFASPQEFSAMTERLGIDEAEVREIVRQNLRIRAYVDQRFAADTPERAQAAIADWIAGLRRRAEIIETPAARQ